jgi:hypothetical protein
MNWRNMQGNHGFWNRFGPAQSFSRVTGVITEWGDLNVTGAMQSRSRTIVVDADNIRQGSTATAIWTEETSRPISNIRARENFTYTFYTARLTEASLSSLNVTGYRYFLNGTWNVYQVTSTFTIVVDDVSDEIISFNRNQNAVALVTDAYGELTVTDGTFVISITGMDPLTGTVFRERFLAKLCNPFQIGFDDSTTVTQADVAALSASYGACPGWGNYDQVMDYNFNYKVDICDLATAAANLNA